MGALLVVLVGLGALAMLAGGVWILIRAFQESVLWGLACLFVPGASVVFFVMHWQDTKIAGGLWLGGAALIVLGSAISASTYQERAADAAAASASARTPTRGVKCSPGDPVKDGFSRWCCTGTDWEVMAQSCAELTRPSTACGPDNAGATSLEACSSGGGDPRTRPRGPSPFR